MTNGIPTEREPKENIMPQDLYAIRREATELNALLKGAKVNKITEPSPEEIVMTVYNKTVYNVVFCAGARFPRVSLTNARKENPQNAPNFLMCLRKHLSGAEITGAEVLNDDRIIAVNFKNLTEFKDDKTYSVITEIMGKYSNVFLTADGVIAGILKTSPQGLDGKRPLFIGSEYVFPEKRVCFLPRNGVSLDDAFKDFDPAADFSKFLMKKFSEFAPVTADEISFRYENSGYEKTAFGARAAIFDFLNEKNNPNAVTIDGKRDFFVTDYKHLSTDKKYFPSVLDCMTEVCDNAETDAYISGKRNALLQKISVIEKRENKKLILTEERIREGKEAEKARLFGELLTANCYKIKSGADSVTLENYYSENGGTVTVPLDKTLSANANAQKYFKKYSKLKKGAKIAAEQKENILKELDYVSSVKFEINAAKTAEEFEEIAQELLAQGIIPKNGNKKRQEKQKTSPYATYLSEGFKIIAGKNNVQNDKLFKERQNGDIWLHAKNYHSSHVYIVTEGKPVPDGVLKTAAEICAYRSESKGGKTEIDYTLLKFVKKISGAKPGSVTYSDYKTIIVTPLAHEELKT